MPYVFLLNKVPICCILYFLQVILDVYLDNSHERVVSVPLTPDTLCADVIACCAQPGEQQCHLAELWRGCGKDIISNNLDKKMN